MAHDPSFPKYAQDFIMDTMFLSDAETCAYSKLEALCWMKSDLTIDEANKVHPLSFEIAKKFDKKFTVTDGKIFCIDHIKTKIFREKQTNNGNKGGRPKKEINPKETQTQIQKKPFLNEIEIEIEDELVNEIALNRNGFFINEISKKILLQKSEIENTKVFIEVQTKVNLSDEDIGNYFEAFKIDNFDKKEWYNSYSDLISHFRNSLKVNLKNGTHQRNNGKAKLGTSDARIEALKKW